MVQFVLQQNVKLGLAQLLAQGKPDVMQQMTAVAFPGQRDDLYLVALILQMLNQPAIVEVATGDCVQTAVDDEPNLHFSIQ